MSGAHHHISAKQTILRQVDKNTISHANVNALVLLRQEHSVLRGCQMKTEVDKFGLF